jgi:hypothetical protein
MHFPRHWARGEHDGFRAWKWSDVSPEDAAARAQAAARALAERVATDEPKRPNHDYPYPTGPLREPVLSVVATRDGAPTAVVSRNAGGVRVLNTADVMFVDIDFPQPVRPGLFARLFARRPPEPPDETGRAQLGVVATWLAAHPEWGFRVYRTRAGLRLLATHGRVDAAGSETDRVFGELGADALYRRLCRSQKSFRARLSPKPWRIGLRAPGVRWPWIGADDERKFASWNAEYERAAAGYATCAFLERLGVEEEAAELRDLIRLHDAETRADAALPLA